MTSTQLSLTSVPTPFLHRSYLLLNPLLSHFSRFLSKLPLMADRPTTPQRPSRSLATIDGSAFLRKLQAYAPNSSQLVGFLTLLISGSILLLLSGITVTVAVLGLIFLTPLIIVSSPIWLPVGIVLFLTVAGFLSICGVGVAVVGGLSWLYRYYRGMNPPGSDRFDYARSRIFDTASHMKDYAREYGGYLQSKVKDAAPGAWWWVGSGRVYSGFVCVFKNGVVWTFAY